LFAPFGECVGRPEEVAEGHNIYLFCGRDVECSLKNDLFMRSCSKKYENYMRLCTNLHCFRPVGLAWRCWTSWPHGIARLQRNDWPNGVSRSPGPTRYNIDFNTPLRFDQVHKFTLDWNGPMAKSDYTKIASTKTIPVDLDVAHQLLKKPGVVKQIIINCHTPKTESSKLGTSVKNYNISALKVACKYVCQNI
jgi:hypothetical protein